MNGFSFRKLWVELCSEKSVILFLCGEALRIARRTAWLLVFVSALAGGGVWLLFPHDPETLKNINLSQPESLRPVARWFSFWGDFYTGSLILSLSLWYAGFISKRRFWRVVALACLLGSGVGGISANVFRLTLGRPRPSAHVKDGFYGIKMDYAYHGFPSGHAATAFGSAGALVAACPVAGAVVLCGAAGVAWSRLYLERHYVSDVATGGGIGLVIGLLFGAAAKRRKEDA